MTLPAHHPLNTGATSGSLLVRNMRGQRTGVRPVWFMRQAGRSLPEYRAARAGIPMLDSCLNPQLAAEITMQPVRRHRVDAAIFFSDIVVPLKLAGVAVQIEPGVGPVVDAPVRSAEDVARLRSIEPDALAPIIEAVAALVEELGSTPLIGFGGAPFTLASYLVEGGPSRELPHTRAMMREQPALWAAVLSWCAEVTAQFITAQVRAGASALQVFDSWAGKLSSADYLAYAHPYSTQLFASLQTLVDAQGQPVPRVHFGVGTGQILRAMHEAGATVMGVDGDTRLSEATRVLGSQVPLQGNIATGLLTGEWDQLAAHTREVIAEGAGAGGHVVNLGHGVPKDTDPDVLTRLSDFVHECTE